MATHRGRRDLVRFAFLIGLACALLTGNIGHAAPRDFRQVVAQPDLVPGGRAGGWVPDNPGDWHWRTPRRGVPGIAGSTVPWSFLTQTVPARVHRLYRVSARVRAEEVPPPGGDRGNVFVWLDGLDARGRVIQTDWGVSLATRTWTEVSRSVMSVPGIAVWRIRLAKRGGPGAVWFERVQVLEGPEIHETAPPSLRHRIARSAAACLALAHGAAQVILETMTARGFLGLLSLLSAWPLVAAVAPRRAGLGVRLATAAGLGALAQALGLFWIGLRGPGSFSLGYLAGLHGMVAGVGVVALLVRSGEREPFAAPPRPAWEPAADLLWIGLGLLAAASVLHSPFTAWDTIAQWGLKAKRLFRVGGFEGVLYPEDAFDVYQSYPPLVPLLYASTWLWTGGVREGMALFTGVLFGLATFAATRALGDRMGSRGSGALAAAVLALSAFFSAHLVSGYADVPHALYVTLAVYWLMELAEAPRVGTACLAAVSLAGAAWSKPTGLAVLGLAGGAAALAAVRNRRTGAWMSAAVLGGTALAVPWFLRTYLIFGTFVPSQWWSDLARHTQADLIPFYRYRSDIGLAAALMATLGQARALGSVLRAPVVSLMLLGYLLVWWWKLSYDPRLFLPVFPLAVALGAGLWLRLWRRPPAMAVIALGTIVLGMSGWHQTVYPQQAVFLTGGSQVAAPRERLDAGLEVARYLRLEAARGPVDLVTNDGRLAYQLDGTSRIRISVGLPYRLAHLRGATHLSLGPWTDWFASLHHIEFARTEVGRAEVSRRRFRRLLSVDGFRLYRIRGIEGAREPMRF